MSLVIRKLSLWSYRWLIHTHRKLSLWSYWWQIQTHIGSFPYGHIDGKYRHTYEAFRMVILMANTNTHRKLSLWSYWWQTHTHTHTHTHTLSLSLSLSASVSLSLFQRHKHTLSHSRLYIHQREITVLTQLVCKHCIHEITETRRTKFYGVK